MDDLWCRDAEAAHDPEPGGRWIRAFAHLLCHGRADGLGVQVFTALIAAIAANPGCLSLCAST